MNSNFKHQSIQKHFGVIIENDKVITNITDSTENISKGSIFLQDRACHRMAVTILNWL